MSQALTVINNSQTDLALGGIGLDSDLFKLRPSYFELVQPTTQQKDATPGRFRNTATNEHFDEIRVVMLVKPIPQRQLYKKGAFSKDNKLCFSVDNVMPHAKAKEPKAINCSVCEFGDKNWIKYRQTNNPDDMPPCKLFYHVVFAERGTQMIHYIDVKGKSVTPFKQSMQNLARTLAGMEANVRAKNKQIAAANAALTDPNAERAAFEPLPNLFDVSFTMYAIKEGTAYIIGIKEIKALNPDSRKEFGNIFLEYFNSRQQGNVIEPEVETEEQEVSAAVTEAPAAQEVVSVIGQPVTGEYVDNDGKITI